MQGNRRMSVVILVTIILVFADKVSSFRNSNPGKLSRLCSRCHAVADNDAEPILLRAAKGNSVERTPVWMMRQAGRHMQAYRDLCKVHKTFRERSEIPEIATEISLQPWQSYKTDGCILFSDILTPFQGMGIPFDIMEKDGPKLEPFTSMNDALRISPMDPAKSTPFVGKILRNLRHAVRNSATVLGFVGLPFTLATYLIEGGSSIEFKKTKTMGYESPLVLHEILTRLADNIAQYALYQIEEGAQVIQVFDSWAGVLSPEDYDVFAAPYQRKVIDAIKDKYPETPVIIYINRSGALLERIANSGADIVSLDWTVSIVEARKRLGGNIGIQGNLDPMILFAPDEIIRSRIADVLKEARGARHIMNLGHGIDACTSEEKAKLFVEFSKSYQP